MKRNMAIEYARQWTQAWNNRDIEAVLEHFEDDVVFSSPKASITVGVPSVRGKEALHRYWRLALEKVTSLKFTLRRVIWDPETSELSIIYDREINGQNDRASEVLQFNEKGRVPRGEVFYGVVP